MKSTPDSDSQRCIRIPFASVVAVCCTVALHTTAAAQPLDPLDFSPLGTLNLSGGGFTIDTDALTIVDDAAPGTPLFTGVSDDQSGTADYTGGVWVPASVGIPEIAVFTFDEIQLQSDASITVIGNRALALLSHGNVTIDTTIDLSGEDVGFTFAGVPAPAGVGRAGGFSGGFSGLPTVPGDGPGGGDGAILWIAGSGGFGGPGESGFNTGLPGAAYGELVFGPLQGGSGGGSQFENKGGAAGGGALEISAVGSVTLAAGGNLIVAGGDVDTSFGSTSSVAGGVGSGGGIRIQGQSVDLLGSIDASASHVIAGGGQSDGGGGRVAVFGSNQLFEFIVGVTNPSSLDTSMINVEGGTLNAGTRGLISVSPLLTTIPSGQSFTLGQVTDLSDANRRLELGHRSNVRVQQGGEAVIPIEGYDNRWKIELFPGDSRILGPGTLDNQGELSGSGTVETAVQNSSGGTIDAINDGLSFTASVTNNAGGQINAINSTLGFPGDGIPTSGGGDNSDGLTNHGDLNLISTTVGGDVHSPAGSNIFVGGTGVVFNGLVSGGANFPGVGAVTFNGGYAPGDSPAEVSLGGNVNFGAANTVFVELSGTTPGSQHDRVNVAGHATLDGTLDVALIDAFLPTPGDSFEVMTFASRSGEFTPVTGDVGLLDPVTFLLPLYSDTNLLLFTAIPGDGNLSGVVEAGDYTLWADGFGLPDPLFTTGDYNGNGEVGPEDYTLWANNFGLMVSTPALAKPVAPSSHASAAVVPEPSTLALFGLGAALLLWRRRSG